MELNEDYQEIIELLEAYSQDVPVPLELPEHDQLVDISEELLLPIPNLYRQFLLYASDLVIGSLEPMTAADPSSHTYLAEVTAQAWDLGLSRELLPVCAYKDGYFAVNQEDVIHTWSPTEGLKEEVAESIWHWARDVWRLS